MFCPVPPTHPHVVMMTTIITTFKTHPKGQGMGGSVFYFSLMTEQTNLASELCPLVGVVAPGCGGGGCHLISISSQKSPIFAQQLEMEEPLGSRILVGYDNAHEEQP